jgi:hypothetical protein
MDVKQLNESENQTIDENKQYQEHKLKKMNEG